MRGLRFTRECNRPQPAINPQHKNSLVYFPISVIDPSLRSIRNAGIVRTSTLISVIDPSLRSIRNSREGRRCYGPSVIDPSLRSIRNSDFDPYNRQASVIAPSLRSIRNRLRRDTRRQAV